MSDPRTPRSDRTVHWLEWLGLGLERMENAEKQFEDFARTYPSDLHAPEARERVADVQAARASFVWQVARFYIDAERKPWAAVVYLERLLREFPESPEAGWAEVELQRIRAGLEALPAVFTTTDATAGLCTAEVVAGLPADADMGRIEKAVETASLEIRRQVVERLAGIGVPDVAGRITFERTITPPDYREVWNLSKGAAFGLTTPDTAVQTSPKNVIGLRFADPIEEARKIIGELRGKADFIVAITHLGYEDDLKLGEAVDGLDLIIGGHSHTEVQPPTEAGDTLVCQAQSYGLFLGQVDMLVSKGDIVKYRGFLRPVDERSRPKPEVQAIVDKYAGELEERLAEVVATTTVDLDGIREHIRASETNLGNLVCDLIREYAQADVCLWNGGGIRASIDAGPITVGDILTVLPFGNIVANKQVTGAELRKVLEFNAAQPRPFGGFTQVSGMTMEIIGDKLGKVTVGGQPLDDTKTYTLAASEFMLAGGDGYSMLTEGSEPVYLGYSESAIVLEALRELGTVSPAVEGRILIK